MSNDLDGVLVTLTQENWAALQAGKVVRIDGPPAEGVPGVAVFIRPPRPVEPVQTESELVLECGYGSIWWLQVECEGPVDQAVVRYTATGQVISATPVCRGHGLRVVARLALAAGAGGRAELKLLDEVTDGE